VSNINDNQFELSIPPIHSLRPVDHSHSEPTQRHYESGETFPFAKVGPVVKPGETIEHQIPGGKSWTQRVPETRTVQPPLFMMPHELAHHSDLRDLGHDDSELDSHGMPTEHGYLDEDTHEDLMQRKLYAPHPDSAHVAESVKKHGIQVPLEVSIYSHGDLKVEDGHHRLAAALAHRPNDFVPIDWENVVHEEPHKNA
jgi:hypothetical protein